MELRLSLIHIFVVDKLMYGVDAGKLALIVTEKGPQIAAKIDAVSYTHLFIYLEKDRYPTEEEQFSIYKTAVETMAGKRVIIRTPVSYTHLHTPPFCTCLGVVAY